MKIRDEHPDLHGSFTCLGNWYNLFSEASMAKLEIVLEAATPADR